jgi:hypothetical protein
VRQPKTVLREFLQAGLLSQQQVQEINEWFKASSRTPGGLELPEHLHQALQYASALSTPVEWMTMH